VVPCLYLVLEDLHELFGASRSHSETT
jgi:hypothetical protein